MRTPFDEQPCLPLLALVLTARPTLLHHLTTTLPRPTTLPCQTLRELYDAALPFEHFEERLYGPQEDEIGEEAMNPLRFAKSVRQVCAAG